MRTPGNKKDLEDLIKNKIEESFELDYKNSDSIAKSEGKIKEIAKDVSAMANSAGGIIIYGIEEKDKRFPDKITPVDAKEFSKEWLDQIISSNISPKIEDLRIIAINVDGGLVYVVEVPQSNIAHQNTKDQRYYKRRNFLSEPMFDYEIKDVMNRAKYPVIKLEFEIEEEREGVFFLKIRPVNKGRIYANFVNYFVELPKNILSKSELYDLKLISKDIVEFYGENLILDSASSRFDPILPGVYGRSERISLDSNPTFGDKKIKWRVHADNAPIQSGEMLLKQITVRQYVK